MIVTTGNDVSGRTVTEYLGVVRGIVVRAPSISQGFLGGLKQIVGGNIESYAKACETARQEAFARMRRHAEEVGFDAAMSSDHFSPWSTRQGHSGLAWSWLGAALATTSRPLGCRNRHEEQERARHGHADQPPVGARHPSATVNGVASAARRRRG